MRTVLSTAYLPTALALLWLLCVSTPASAAPAGPPLVFASSGGELRIEPKVDLLNTLGLELASSERKQRGMLVLPLQADHPLLVELGDGAPTAVREGRLGLPGLALVRGDGRRSPALFLQAQPQRRLGFDVVDEHGALWLRIGHAMRSPTPGAGLTLSTADARVGPALARWTGSDSEGLLFARIELHVPFTLPPAAAHASAKSCEEPNWPTAGFTVDVELTNIDRVTPLRCRVLGGAPAVCGGSSAFSCDGPGGQEGEVVFVPDATLRNTDTPQTADVPWYRKFRGEFAPYGNDQHPFLVWNLYRIDADGALTQIARSGLKHAFATANFGCSDTTCRTNGDILGRGCSDLYDAGSNDTPTALAPRAEVVAASGQWGRCGSVFDSLNNTTGDPGCDGVQDSTVPPGDDCYRYRMVARESDIDPSEHPGARWFIDAWYLVRGDVDVFNTMGYRQIHPTWSTGFPQHWSPGALGAFANGSIVDLWLAEAPPTEWTSRTVAASSEGQALLATRVSRDGAVYRYDYALANLDRSRTTTDGAEPNLRVLSNFGLASVIVQQENGATASAGGFSDGDADAANDWLATSDRAATRWDSPGEDARLSWGQLMTFTLYSVHPPGPGNVELALESVGEPDNLLATALVPDGSRIFADRFE